MKFLLEPNDQIQFEIRKQTANQIVFFNWLHLVITKPEKKQNTKISTIILTLTF